MNVCSSYIILGLLTSWRSLDGTRNTTKNYLEVKNARNTNLQVGSFVIFNLSKLSFTGNTFILLQLILVKYQGKNLAILRYVFSWMDFSGFTFWIVCFKINLYGKKNLDQHSVSESLYFTAVAFSDTFMLREA